MIDRFDIQIEVPSLSVSDIRSKAAAESSASIKARVDAAVKIQSERLKNSKNRFNAAMSHKEITKFCEIEEVSASMLEKAMEQLSLSARAYDKILKVSRTIADLDGAGNISQKHILEALQYRSFDRI
jgi:magnesium chelatase family protein